MKRLLALCAALVVLGAAPAAFGQAHDLGTYIDATRDGLPDEPGSIRGLAIGVPDTFDIYLNATNFPNGLNWTAFNYAFTIGPPGAPDSTTNWFSGDTSMVTVIYDSSPTTGVGTGSPFVEDNFSLPYGYTLGGQGYDVPAALRRLATVIVIPIRNSGVGAACIQPVVDVYATAFCQLLRNPGTYGVFDLGTVSGSCFTIGVSPTEATSWGKVKGLFK
jgi:hypothetical protein